jgi:hypothetical protein
MRRDMGCQLSAISFQPGISVAKRASDCGSRSLSTDGAGMRDFTRLDRTQLVWRQRDNGQRLTFERGELHLVSLATVHENNGSDVASAGSMFREVDLENCYPAPSSLLPTLEYALETAIASHQRIKLHNLSDRSRQPEGMRRIGKG